MLRPWLGSDFLAHHAELISILTTRFCVYQADRDDLRDLSQWVDNLLFMAVREGTRGKMLLMLDDGMTIRVRIDDFAVMTDDLMYLLFYAMPRDEEHFMRIREYSITKGSLSALRALYLDYQPFQTETEWQTVRRVITSCHDEYRWRRWINIQSEQRGQSWEE